MNNEEVKIPLDLRSDIEGYLSSHPQEVSKNMSVQEREQAADEFNTLVDEFHKEQAEAMNPMAGMTAEQLFKQLPRKMRRKIFRAESFSSKFKRNMTTKL